MTQRRGRSSRALLIEETTPGVDPGSPLKAVIPLATEESFNHTRDRVDAEVWKGDGFPFGSILTMQNAAGDLPIQLEHTFVGRILRILLGSSAAPATIGGGYLHYFSQVAQQEPKTFQIQKEFLDQTPLYDRHKAIIPSNWRMGFTPAGVAGYTVGGMGRGTRVETAIAGGSEVDDGYSGRSYFNGYLLMDDVRQAGIRNYEMNWELNPERTDVAFLDGIAGDIIPDVLNVRGVLELMLEADFAFIQKAANDNAVKLEKMWTHPRVAIATQWLHVILGIVRFSEGSANVGGKAGRRINQPYKNEYDSLATGACAMPGFTFSNPGPFTIPSPGNLGVKVNGGGTVTKALTPGSQTAAQIVTSLLASGGIAGATSEGWPADSQGSFDRFRIRSNTLGTGSSIQIDTGIADSAHAALGLDGTVRTGKAPSPVHGYLFNARPTAYP